MTACGFDGCDKPAYRSSKLCTGHRSQKQRGQELRPLAHRPPVEGDCVFVGCDRPARTRQLCAGHYNQLNRGAELKPLDRSRKKRGDVCTFPDCGKAHHTGGLCAGHNSQRKRGQELRPIRVAEKKTDRPKRAPKAKPLTCSFPGCDRPHEAHGLCGSHSKQRRRGIELKPLTPRAPRREAPPTEPGFTWTPGTLWPTLEKADTKKPSTLSADVSPATLLHTSVVIDDATAAACRSVLEAWDATDLAEMLLGVAA